MTSVTSAAAGLGVLHIVVSQQNEASPNKIKRQNEVRSSTGIAEGSMCTCVLLPWFLLKKAALASFCQLNCTTTRRYFDMVLGSLYSTCIYTVNTFLTILSLASFCYSTAELLNKIIGICESIEISYISRFTHTVFSTLQYNVTNKIHRQGIRH